MSENVILYYPKTDHEKFYKYYWIPYSLLTIASGCINRGYNVKLIDANAGDDSQFINNLDKELCNTICVGISCMTGNQIREGLDFAEKVREYNPEIPLIWGGPHPTLFPEQTIKNEFVDFLIQGQGEIRLPKLIDAIRYNWEKPYLIEGVGEKYDGKIYIKKGHKVDNKKDFPPFPWDLLNLERYIKNDDDVNSRTLNYISSQGCPFRCGFCSEVALYHSQWTSFDVERVMYDLDYLITNYNLNGIKFYDANFFGNIERVLTIAQKLVPYNIKWAASGHPATLSMLKDEDWFLLKKSGCNRLLIGLESGSQLVLNSIKKNFDIHKSLELAAKLKKYNIIGSFTFIVGFPERVDEYEVEKTLELAKKIRKISEIHECKIHFYAPYPGTPLWEEALKRGFVAPQNFEEWSSFDYYCIETPWMKKELEQEIHLFNKENCPYVHL